MRIREIGKFVAGFAASQVLTHGGMAIDGTRFTLLGMEYTPELNSTAAGLWAVLLVLAAYYSWIRRHRDGEVR